MKRWVLLLALLPTWAWGASYHGHGAILTNNNDTTNEVTCIYDVLSINLQGTLSSGDTVTLQGPDWAGTPNWNQVSTETQWASTDMNVSVVHVCSGRTGQTYRLILSDADNSSEVYAELRVLPRASTRYGR